MAIVGQGPDFGVEPDVALARMLGVLGYAAVSDEETFRERVKRLRERTGLSQIEFADKAGLSREGYQKIERGVTTHPDNDTVRGCSGGTTPTARRPVLRVVGGPGGVGLRPTESSSVTAEANGEVPG